MSQRNKGTFEQLYDKFDGLSPETKKRLFKVLERVVNVAVEADAAAEAERNKGNSTECVPNYSKQELKLIEDLDYAIDIFERMNLTPSSPKGGSRKRSINCRRPRGFSQRQHCKYGRSNGVTRTRRIKLNRSS
jgi:hypothetical protein